MPHVTDYLTPGAKLIRGYAERLLFGVTPEMFARKPRVGGTLIETNHPAFNYGHLALYPTRVSEFLKIDGFPMPDGYEALFKDGTPCHDDPEGTAYPSKDSITATYFDGYDRLLAVIGQAPEELFAAEMWDPKRKERFPTCGAFVAYLLLAHQQVHLGQISTWRRCMGLASA